MVQILGVNSNIIVGLLCVYYWEVNAAIDKLEFWKPDPAFDRRRIQQIKKPEKFNKVEGEVDKTVEEVKPYFRSNKDEPEKFTRGFREQEEVSKKYRSLDNSPDESFYEDYRSMAHNKQKNRHLKKKHPSHKHAHSVNVRAREKNYNAENNRKVNSNTNPTTETTSVKEDGSKDKGDLKQKIQLGRSGSDGDKRSTRISLVPQADEAKNSDQKEKEKQDTLSPYSVATQMNNLMEEYTEANATVEVLGRTAEYNEIVIIKITGKNNESGKYFRAESKYIDEIPEKMILFIVHGLSVMGMGNIDQLNSFSNGLKTLIGYYLNFLDKFDIFLIPLANPDGYTAVRAKGLWNKNMSPQDACPGVALDRNFDVGRNASRQFSSCSQLYPGPFPFSEIETKVIREVFHYFGHKIIAYVHVHGGTYDHKVFKGDAILYPKGYCDSTSDDDRYIDLRAEIDEAMKNASFQVMSVTVDTLHNWYGKVGGTSVDYASTVYGIPYAVEFVMQSYRKPHGHYALTEIWSRLINTTFNNIWNGQNHINDKKKK